MVREKRLGDFKDCQESCMTTEGCGYFTHLGGIEESTLSHCLMFDDYVGCPEIVDEPVDGDFTCAEIGCNTGVPCGNATNVSYKPKL